MNKNLIFEKLSISDDVLKISNTLKPLILDKIKTTDGIRHNLMLSDFCIVKNCEIILTEPIFGFLNTILVKYISFFSTEDLVKYKKNGITIVITSINPTMPS